MSQVRKDSKSAPDSTRPRWQQWGALGRRWSLRRLGPHHPHERPSITLWEEALRGSWIDCTRAGWREGGSGRTGARELQCSVSFREPVRRTPSLPSCGRSLRRSAAWPDPPGGTPGTGADPPGARQAAADEPRGCALPLGSGRSPMGGVPIGLRVGHCIDGRRSCLL